MFFLQKAFLFLDYEKIKLPIDCINTKNNPPNSQLFVEFGGLLVLV